VVSQFTLYADTRRGRRPSFVEAARPSRPSRCSTCWSTGCAKLGAPGRDRTVPDPHARSLTNDGPVTVLLEV
jgi:D-aminoacyl-tRNA deacylase